MSPKQPPNFRPQLGRLSALSRPEAEAAFDELAERAEARGNGVAGELDLEQELPPVEAPSPAKTAPAVGRVGTLERPYLRKRDRQQTRKFAVVLPVKVIKQLQRYCIETDQRPNAVVEQAVVALLAAIKNKPGSERS